MTSLPSITWLPRQTINYMVTKTNHQLRGYQDKPVNMRPKKNITTSTITHIIFQYG